MTEHGDPEMTKLSLTCLFPPHITPQRQHHAKEKATSVVWAHVFNLPGIPYHEMQCCLVGWLAHIVCSRDANVPSFPAKQGSEASPSGLLAVSLTRLRNNSEWCTGMATQSSYLLLLWDEAVLRVRGPPQCLPISGLHAGRHSGWRGTHDEVEAPCVWGQPEEQGLHMWLDD